MTPEIPFKLVAEGIQKSGRPLILIGGQAMALRGYQRATLDIDFMMTETDYEKLKPVLSGEGYHEVARTAVAAKLSPESENLLDMDILFVDEKTFCAVQKDAKKETFQGVSFLVPSVEHLIALKLHAIKQQPGARELKDLGDIVELIKSNHLNAHEESFKKLCLKFGTPDIYKKIINYTQHG